MNQWVVVGQEHSGDEDTNISTVEAFGPFDTETAAEEWLDNAPTFDGVIHELRDPDEIARAALAGDAETKRQCCYGNPDCTARSHWAGALQRPETKEKP